MSETETSESKPVVGTRVLALVGFLVLGTIRRIQFDETPATNGETA